MIEVLVIFVCLALAIHLDLNRGRIPNWIFTLMVAGSVPLQLAGPLPLSLYLVSLLGTFLIALGLWKLGAWGGGDAKLVIGMAALMPSAVGGLFIPPYGRFFIFPFFLNFAFVYLFRIFHLAYTRMGQKAVFRIVSVLLGLFAFYTLALLLGSWALFALLLPFLKPRRYAGWLDWAAPGLVLLAGIYLRLPVFAPKIGYIGLVFSALALGNEIGMFKPTKAQYTPVKLSPLLAAAFIVTVFVGDVFWGAFF